LIAYWQSALEQGNEIDGLLALRVAEQLQAAPELFRPIEEASVLEAHRELIELLMTALLPPALRHQRISAAISPNQFETIYATPGFDELMATNEGELHLYAPHRNSALMQNKLLWPCSFILDKCYGVNIINEISLIFRIPDKHTQLDRFFKPSLNTRFSKICNCTGQRELSAAQIQLLLNELDNEALWLKHFSPGNFEFEGFVWMDLIEVTEAEIRSQLKYELLHRKAFLSDSCRTHIRNKIRSLLRLPDLKLGFFPVSVEAHTLHHYGKHLWNSLASFSSHPHDLMQEPLYREVFEQKKMVIVDDLGRRSPRTELENAMLKRGIRNLLIAPLVNEQGLVGMLELGTGRPGQLSAVSTIQLREVLPLFAVAMERSLLEREHQVQALIKEKCTAIHPTVAWRFRQAGLRLLEKLESGQQAELEPIVFRQVYPLYGNTDVRNSSEARNTAIQSDLIQQLSLAQQVIHYARIDCHLPLLKELDQRIRAFKIKLETGISSGDEALMLEFIHREIEPAFEQLQQQYPQLEPIVNMYHSALDDELGIVYKRRKDYEQSIALLNESLAAVLEQEQVLAQQIFPHYFTKLQTDGIEYNMYVGDSLVPWQQFELRHLRMLRFWQLAVTCKLARMAAQIRPQLPMPLQVAQLILLYPTPLTIRFRTDDKQFDVDGAYNLRYEILKKRIDKARIAGSRERLTQPGKIAIVYTQEKDIEEYHSYISHLTSKGYLQPAIERLELESQAGVKGLKALRVSLNLYTHAEEITNDYQQIFAEG